MQAALTCNICTEPYRAPPHANVPKMLKCGHTLCGQCVSTLEGSQYPRCPTCRGDLVVLCVNMMLAEFGEKFYKEAEEKRDRVRARIAAREAEEAAKEAEAAKASADAAAGADTTGEASADAPPPSA